VAGFGSIDPGAALIAMAARGERAAREEIYVALSPIVRAFARRMCTPAAADDIMQDTLLAVFEHLADFRGDCPFGLWVRRIALTRCLMHLRSPWHRVRATLHASIADELPAPGAPVGELLDLQRALDELPPTPRAVLWMYEVEGYTHEEIARAFGRSVSFSKSQLARAHARLHKVRTDGAEEATCLAITD
jgi:RNA polymerase sigma-70 factor (ECF subfamily)